MRKLRAEGYFSIFISRDKRPKVKFNGPTFVKLPPVLHWNIRGEWWSSPLRKNLQPRGILTILNKLAKITSEYYFKRDRPRQDFFAFPLFIQMNGEVSIFGQFAFFLRAPPFEITEKDNLPPNTQITNLNDSGAFSFVI